MQFLRLFCVLANWDFPEPELWHNKQSGTAITGTSVWYRNR